MEMKACRVRATIGSELSTLLVMKGKGWANPLIFGIWTLNGDNDLDNVCGGRPAWRQVA